MFQSSMPALLQGSIELAPVGIQKYRRARRAMFLGAMPGNVAAKEVSQHLRGKLLVESSESQALF
jgi:hypothetical protein